jgi:hypothetical protein
MELHAGKIPSVRPHSTATTLQTSFVVLRVCLLDPSWTAGRSLRSGHRIASPAVRTNTFFVGSLIRHISPRDLEWHHTLESGGGLHDVAVCGVPRGTALPRFPHSPFSTGSSHAMACVTVVRGMEWGPVGRGWCARPSDGFGRGVPVKKRLIRFYWVLPPVGPQSLFAMRPPSTRR